MKKISRAPFMTAIAGAVLIACAPAARALEWAQTEIERHAAVGRELDPFVFTFTNTGSAAVTITNMRASCGCLDPEVNPKTVAPAASGTLTVLFDRAGLVGDISRAVVVTTDEPRAAPYQLTVRASLPAAITLAPRLVHWKTGAPAAAKSVDITINLPGGLALTGAASNTSHAPPHAAASGTAGNKGALAATLVTLEPRRHYRLDLAPRDTTGAFLAVVTLQTDEPVPADTPLTVYAQVR